jgi:hypothetical protein
VSSGLWFVIVRGVEGVCDEIDAPFAELEVMSGVAEPDDGIEELDAPRVRRVRVFELANALLARQRARKPPAPLSAAQVSVAELRVLATARLVSAFLGLADRDRCRIDVVEPVYLRAADAQIGIERAAIQGGGLSELADGGKEELPAHLTATRLALRREARDVALAIHLLRMQRRITR